MNECNLVEIFDSSVEGSSDVVQYPTVYDDSFAYMQKQGTKTKVKKPLPPSQQAVASWFAGEKGALLKIGKTFALRSVLIGSAIYVFGDRKNLVKNSLVASGSIEAFLIYWYRVKHGDK